jgi:hypothetical protein
MAWHRSCAPSGGMSTDPRAARPQAEAAALDDDQAIDLPNREALSLIGGAGILGGPPTIYGGPEPVDAGPISPEPPIQPEPPTAA